MSKNVLEPIMTPSNMKDNSLEARGGTHTGHFSKSDSDVPKKADKLVHRNGTLSNGSIPRSDTKNISFTSTDSGTTPPEELNNDSSGSSFLVLGAIFIISLLIIVWVYSSFPKLEEADKEHIKLPRNIEDAKVLGTILNRYKERYYMAVLTGVSFVYLFLQTFAIPGSIFLSILCGFLFSFWVALFLVCFCSATGATFCYGLSWLVGRRLIYKYFPEKVQAWSATVNRHRDNLLNYIIFLRITPFLPNWFINITSPVIGVPLFPFWLGTFLGVAPPSFVAIQAGTTLSQLSSSSDALSWTSVIVLIVLGVVSLIPVIFKNTLNRRFR